MEAPTAEPALGRVHADLRSPEDVVAEAAVEVDVALEPFELLTAPRGAPDDLAKLHGVGPQLVKKLNDGGIFHYWQIASMTPADVEKLDLDLKLNGRIARDGWVDQARSLASA